MHLLVLGGSGLAGSAVTAEAAARGHRVRTFTRRRPRRAPAPRVQSFTGDLLTGRGLAEACAGAQAVIDCVNIETLRGSTASRFFVDVMGHSVPAAAQAGVHAYVLLSIVGTDRFPLGYYRAKATQESRMLDLADQIRPRCARSSCAPRKSTTSPRRASGAADGDLSCSCPPCASNRWT